MSTPDFLESILYVVMGSGYTIALILGAMILGFIIGLPLASIQIYGRPWLKFMASTYVWFFRGIPILILLFLIYYGIFGLLENFLIDIFKLRTNLSPFLASILALGLASGAYQSQIFRGAIMSLSRGQWQAASSLGFSRISSIINIILPQALRLSIPAWSNEYSILLKDSAVAYVLGTLEIMARTRLMASLTFKHLPFYLLAGLIYFALTWLGVTALRYLEKKTRIPGLGYDSQTQNAASD